MNTKSIVLLTLSFALMTAQVTVAQSASELLEKAIYTEETVGDLNEAIKIYAKIVAEARVARRYAAQAQFRLGMCYVKMGKKSEATAAFKKLVEDFADQKELVAKAREHLPEEGGLELLPAPWIDGEQLIMSANLATGMNIGNFILAVRSDQLDSQDVWRMSLRRHVSLNAPNQGVSRVVASQETFNPISSLFRHSILGTVAVDYTETQAIVTSTGVNGNETTKELNLDGTYYDNEQAMFLFRRLPLKVGYKVNVPINTPVGSGPIEISLDVLAKETINVPAGEFECFKVHLDIVQQTFWYTTDEHRYLAKFEAGGISVELESIESIQPGETVKYENDQFGFSIEPPTPWHLRTAGILGRDKDRVSYVLLDPEAMASSALVVFDADDLSEEERTPRAWAENDIAGSKKAFQDYVVRPGSWRERQLGGKPAISFVADFEQANRKMVEYAVYSVGDNAVVFTTKMSPDWLEKLQEPMDAILDTYQVK